MFQGLRVENLPQDWDARVAEIKGQPEDNVDKATTEAIFNFMEADKADGTLDGKALIDSKQVSLFDLIIEQDRLDQSKALDGSIFNNELLLLLLDLLDDKKTNDSFQSYMDLLQSNEGANPYDSREGYNVFANPIIPDYDFQTRYNPRAYDNDPATKVVNPDSIVGKDVASKAASIALKEVGVCEANDGHLKYSNGKDEAWCAHFVSWAYEQADGGQSPWGHKASVQGIMDWGKQKGKFINKAEAKGNLKVGDVVIYKSNGASHTGLVSKINDDGSINTVEGNTKDAVREQTITLNNSKLTGFVSV